MADKMIVYIKFKHPEAVYLLEPLYNYQEGVPPTQCGKCGGTLYVPITRDDITITKPMGDLIRPFPKEKPNLVWRSEPESPTIEFPHPSIEQTKHLGHLGVVGVHDGTMELLIDDWSIHPKECPICFPEEIEDDLYNA